MTLPNNVVYVIAGATATGKTAAAAELAVRLGGEVVSADSMQIYRYMDIGTAKPTMAERRGAPHHFIDELNPDEPFSAALYQRAARARISEVISRGKTPIVCGGTGLYINALLYAEYDFAERGRDAANPRHAAVGGQKTRTPVYDARVTVLACPRAELYARIERRVDEMMERGLADEVRGLLDMGYGAELPSMQGLGYRQLVPYVRGAITRDAAVEALKRDTRRFAKRQETWFRNQLRL